MQSQRNKSPASVAAAVQAGAERVLSANQARLLQLHAQGLLRRLRRPACPADLLSAIANMRLLQIDSIHVVARSPYFVLFSRLGAYPQSWLDEALANGKLAEAWVHEACYVTAADFPRHRAWREQRAAHWAHRHARRMYKEHRPDMEGLLAKIRESGPIRAAELVSGMPSGGAGWWSWKQEKRWLEAWFALGELMVVRRERFQRVYDLSERVLASLQPAFLPASSDTAVLRRSFILEAVAALGVAQANWIADYHRLKPAVTDAELAPLVVAGELHKVAVTGWKAPAYVRRQHAEALALACSGRLRASHSCLLSPFDPLVWDRRRLRASFGFEYSLECYLPAHKRRFGYYVLPILHRGQLVGRVDAKAHRDVGVFELKALYLQEEVIPTAALARALAGIFNETARWHATPQISLGSCEPKIFLPMLRRALAVSAVPQA